MGTSIPKTFPVDSRGVPISQIPLMKGIENFQQIDMIVSISARVTGIATAALNTLALICSG